MIAAAAVCAKSVQRRAVWQLQQQKKVAPAHLAYLLGAAALALPCLCLQFSVQYRVTDDRLYEAFFSLSNPASQVTSYGGCLPMDGCTHGGYAVCMGRQLLQLCPAQISCGAYRLLNLLAHEPHPACILHFPRSSCLQCWTVWALLCPKWRLSSCSCTRGIW